MKFVDPFTIRRYSFSQDRPIMAKQTDKQLGMCLLIIFVQSRMKMKQ